MCNYRSLFLFSVKIESISPTFHKQLHQKVLFLGDIFGYCCLESAKRAPHRYICLRMDEPKKLPVYDRHAFPVAACCKKRKSCLHVRAHTHERVRTCGHTYARFIYRAQAKLAAIVVAIAPPYAIGSATVAKQASDSKSGWRSDSDDYRHAVNGIREKVAPKERSIAAYGAMILKKVPTNDGPNARHEHE